jgi:hypothetical protein
MMEVMCWPAILSVTCARKPLVLTLTYATHQLIASADAAKIPPKFSRLLTLACGARKKALEFTLGHAMVSAGGLNGA